jgi:thioredoxin reductase
MKNHSNIETLIIGAGPAGMALAGRMKKLNLPFVLIEKSDRVAMAWHQHYERLCLHTVKEHSNLPHIELPDEYPVYPTRLQMIDYWNSYIETMGIQPIYNQEVKSIKNENGGWKTETETDVFISQKVVVATGYNRSPYLPHWEGQDDFKGQFLHSRQYKNADAFAGKQVLIIGMGNTGAELAIDLVEKGAFPTIAVRSPVNFLKRDIKGRPTQRTAIMLGKLPNWLYDFIAKQLQKLVVGDLTPYGLPPSPYAPSQQLREFGKVPIIDIGTIDLIKQGKVKIASDIQHFNEDSVTFKNGETKEFDAVIACTGYRPQVQDFVENADLILDKRGYPKSLWFEEKALKGLYFCGFSIPLSGILRNIKIDSEQIVQHILNEK